MLVGYIQNFEHFDPHTCRSIWKAFTPFLRSRDKSTWLLHYLSQDKADYTGTTFHFAGIILTLSWIIRAVPYALISNYYKKVSMSVHRYPNLAVYHNPKLQFCQTQNIGHVTCCGFGKPGNTQHNLLTPGSLAKRYLLYQVLWQSSLLSH